MSKNYPMLRRGFLYLLAGGGLTYGWLNRDEVSKDLSVGSVEGNVPGLSTPDPNRRNFGFGSPGFDYLEFTGDGRFDLYFNEGHSMDGCGFRHALQDSIEDDLKVWGAPEFAGPITVDFVKLIKGSSDDYPSLKFQLVAYETTQGDRSARFPFNTSVETIGSVTFTLPEKYGLTLLQ